MRNLLQPKTLMEAMEVPKLILEISGLCPYTYNRQTHAFYFCWKKMFITFAHVSVYSYLQLVTILYDFDDYKQPILAKSWINTQINFIIKLLSIVITFAVVSIRFFTIKDLKRHLVAVTRACQLYEGMHDNILSIYQKMQIIVFIIIIWSTAFMGFSIWHTFYYFRLLTGREPKFTLKCLISLSYYYKCVFLAFIWSSVIQIYYIMRATNDVLRKFLKNYVDSDATTIQTKILQRKNLLV